jgi:uncharacterized membrane protein YbjE (DUF340 family)
MVMRIFLYFILIIFLGLDLSLADQVSGIVEYQNMLLQEQNILLQYLLVISSVIIGIGLAFLFLWGLKLR